MDPYSKRPAMSEEEVTSRPVARLRIGETVIDLVSEEGFGAAVAAVATAIGPLVPAGGVAVVGAGVGAPMVAPSVVASVAMNVNGGEGADGSAGLPGGPYYDCMVAAESAYWQSWALVEQLETANLGLLQRTEMAENVAIDRATEVAALRAQLQEFWGALAARVDEVTVLTVLREAADMQLADQEARLTALLAAGVTATNMMNAPGEMVVDWLSNIPDQAHRLARFGIRYGAAAGFTALESVVGVDASEFDLTTPDVVWVMEEWAPDFLATGEEIVEVMPTQWVINDLWEY